MKTETLYCDRCKRPLTKSWRVPIKMWTFSLIGLKKPIIDYADLCPDCKQSFKQWFKGYHPKTCDKTNQTDNRLSSVPFNVPLAHGQSFNQLLYKRMRGEL